jgi:hypothetical protein
MSTQTGQIATLIPAGADAGPMRRKSNPTETPGVVTGRLKVDRNSVSEMYQLFSRTHVERYSSQRTDGGVA